MAERRVRFKQADLARALRAAKDAGLPVARFEIDPEGKIVVVSGEPEKPVEKVSFFAQRRLARERSA